MYAQTIEHYYAGSSAIPLRLLLRAPRSGNDNMMGTASSNWFAYWAEAAPEEKGLGAYLARNKDEARLFWAAFRPSAHPLIWLVQRFGWGGLLSAEVSLVQNLLASSTACEFQSLVDDYIIDINRERPLRSLFGLRMNRHRLESYLTDIFRGFDPSSR